MRFEWHDGICLNNKKLIEYEKKNGISRYECYLYDDSGKKLQEIYFYDYSTKGEVEQAEKNKWRRPYAYKVDYCCGYSMSKGFDKDPDYCNHFGWHGIKKHTVDDIKQWCENYLAKKYIIDYEKELAKLQIRKEQSDWFVSHGYGDIEEKDCSSMKEPIEERD